MNHYIINLPSGCQVSVDAYNIVEALRHYGYEVSMTVWSMDTNAYGVRLVTVH